MLTEKQYDEIRDELIHCKNPLFFFHDDADGLSSFLLFYRLVNEGKGILLKSSPELGLEFLGKVKEYKPDKIFVMDKPKVSQDFVDKAKCRVVWIDHHSPVEISRAKYYNPRISNPNDNLPASYLCYKVVKQDLWIAMAGIIGDWVMPDLAEEFRKKYPKLLPDEIKKAEDALFNSDIGKLSRIFSFVIKGKNTDAMAAIKVLTRIDNPCDILEQKTPQGRFIYKRYEKLKKEYDELLDDIKKNVTKDNILLYIYGTNKNSFTGDLSNEALYLFKDKIILIGREKNSEIKFSIRSSKIVLPPIINKCLVGLQGYGGGHEYATGTCINKDDFKEFYKRFREEIRKEMNLV